MAISPENQNSTRLEDIRSQLRKLAEVSKDLEQHARMQAAAVNFVQAGELKRRMDELTARQDQLVMSIVERHPDAQVRNKFRALGRKIEEFKPKIRSCQDPAELKELRKNIDECVEEWVMQFQTIVSSLVGIAPPDQPVASESPF